MGRIAIFFKSAILSFVGILILALGLSFPTDEKFGIRAILLGIIIFGIGFGYWYMSVLLIVKMLPENKEFRVEEIVSKDEFFGIIKILISSPSLSIFGKIKDKDEFYYQLDMSRFENPRALRKGSKIKNINGTIKIVSDLSS